ncbi:hypothetical protein CCHL11_10271, partial [Colletotrichum chlorophyti]
MRISSTLITLALLAVGINAAPAPLNINLGAYSPALVVGDGALTFGGGEEGGAAEGGKKNGKGAGGGEAAAAAAIAAGGLKRDTNALNGGGTKKVGKRQLDGFDRALTFAEAALTKGPDIQLGTGEGENGKGAGVGIIVDNNPKTAEEATRRGAGAAAGGEA